MHYRGTANYRWIAWLRNSVARTLARGHKQHSTASETRANPSGPGAWLAGRTRQCFPMCRPLFCDARRYGSRDAGGDGGGVPAALTALPRKGCGLTTALKISSKRISTPGRSSERIALSWLDRGSAVRQIQSSEKRARPPGRRATDTSPPWPPGWPRSAIPKPCQWPPAARLRSNRRPSSIRITLLPEARTCRLVGQALKLLERQQPAGGRAHGSDLLHREGQVGVGWML